MTPSSVPNGTNLVFAGKAYLAEGGPCGVVLNDGVSSSHDRYDEQ